MLLCNTVVILGPLFSSPIGWNFAHSAESTGSDIICGIAPFLWVVMSFGWHLRYLGSIFADRIEFSGNPARISFHATAIALIALGSFKD